jgi:hypothetical protein
MYKSIAQSVTKVSKYDDMMNARLSKQVATEFNAQYSAVYSSLHSFWPHEGRKEGERRQLNLPPSPLFLPFQQNSVKRLVPRLQFTPFRGQKR